MNQRRDRIASSFGAAATAYDDHAHVQRLAALAVADLCSLRPLPDRARILEIGCGTGILTRELARRCPAADLVATDLSPNMVERAGRGAMIAGTFLPMDGEQPWFEGPHFDLIASSLAFQWFDDLAVAVERLSAMLRPGGSLIFSTMGVRSFAAWRAAHEACGLKAGIPAYPSLQDVRDILARHNDGFAFDEDYELESEGARALIAHLKGIGAVVPAAGHAPLPPAKLRAVMAAFDESGGHDSYHVIFARVTRLA